MTERELAMVEAGQINEVIALVKARCQSNPQDRDEKMNLASLYTRIRDYVSAITIYQSLLQDDPDDISILVNMGMALHWQKRTAEAINAYFCFFQLLPQHPMRPEHLSLAYSNWGVIMEETAQFDKAVIAYKQALRIFPDNQMASKYLRQLAIAGSLDNGVFRQITHKNGQKNIAIWYYRDIDIDSIDVLAQLGLKE